MLPAVFDVLRFNGLSGRYARSQPSHCNWYANRNALYMCEFHQPRCARIALRCENFAQTLTKFKKPPKTETPFPNVRQLLDCASPLALSPQMGGVQSPAKQCACEKAPHPGLAQPTSCSPPPPKAAEDRRSPRREAASDLGEDSTAFRQAAQPPNGRQLLDCASPLALSPQTEAPKLWRNNLTMKKRHIQTTTHHTSCPPPRPPKRRRTAAVQDAKRPRTSAKIRERFGKPPSLRTCASFWTAPVLWRFPPKRRRPSSGAPV
jgi:hypothetical protein